MNKTQSRAKINIPGMGQKSLAEMKAARTSRHKNSKLVTIYRFNSNMENTQEADAQVKEYMATGKRSIGSYWEGRGSQRKGTGLTDKEISLLLPELVTVPNTDRDFRAKVDLFYTEYNLKIPFANGLTLEIGLLEDNNEPVSETNMPINVHNYVAFRHAIEHPYVALSKEDAIGNKNKWFWIFDAESIALTEKDTIDLKDKANAIYQKLKDNSARRQMMLTLLGKDLRVYSKESNPSVAEMKALRSIAENDPAFFLQQYEHKHFNELFWIRLGIYHEILRKAGNNIMTKEGEMLGVDEEDACLWWKNPENSELVSLLKASIQSASRFIDKKDKVEEKPGD